MTSKRLLGCYSMQELRALERRKIDSEQVAIEITKRGTHYSGFKRTFEKRRTVLLMILATYQLFTAFGLAIDLVVKSQNYELHSGLNSGLFHLLLILFNCFCAYKIWRNPEGIPWPSFINLCLQVVIVLNSDNLWLYAAPLSFSIGVDPLDYLFDPYRWEYALSLGEFKAYLPFIPGMKSLVHLNLMALILVIVTWKYAINVPCRRNKYFYTTINCWSFFRPLSWAKHTNTNKLPYSIFTLTLAAICAAYYIAGLDARSTFEHFYLFSAYAFWMIIPFWIISTLFSDRSARRIILKRGDNPENKIFKFYEFRRPFNFKIKIVVLSICILVFAPLFYLETMDETHSSIYAKKGDIEYFKANKRNILIPTKNLYEYAAIGGSLDFIKYLDTAYPNIKSYKSHIISGAIQAGNLNIIRYLIEDNNIDVNAESYQLFKLHEDRHLPIISAAAAFGQIDIIEYLISKKANLGIDLPVTHKANALAQGIKNAQPASVKILLNLVKISSKKKLEEYIDFAKENHRINYYKEVSINYYDGDFNYYLDLMVYRKQVIVDMLQDALED